MRNPRPFDPPAEVEESATLPAAASGAYPSGRKTAVVGATRIWSCADVYVVAPDEWEAEGVVFSLIGAHGSCELELDTKTLADVRHAQRRSGQVSGLLFSLRDHPCDGFRVDAYHAPVALDEALFRLEGWGQGCSVQGGDLTNNLTVDLFARADRLWNYPDETHPPVPLVVGTTIIADANPNGGRVALTSFSVSANDPTPQLVTLQRTPPVGPPVVVLQMFSGVPFYVGGALSYPWWTLPGGRWEVVLAAVTPGAEHRAVSSGFYE